MNRINGPLPTYIPHVGPHFCWWQSSTTSTICQPGNTLWRVFGVAAIVRNITTGNLDYDLVFRGFLNATATGGATYRASFSDAPCDATRVLTKIADNGCGWPSTIALVPV
jgi:hypothetical protein